MIPSELASAHSVEYSLLGLLSERPMHGYDLHRELKRRTGLGLVWTVKQAHLYAILASLEADGLITALLVDQGNRPARRVLHLTEKGQQELVSWVTTPSARRAFRLDFLAKLRFALKLGGDVTSLLLTRQREQCAAWLSEMRERSVAPADEAFDNLVYRYRIGQLESTIRWLDECEADLQNTEQ